MRLFLPSLLTLGHFLCVSLPVTATTVDSGRIGKGPQEIFGVSEGSKDESTASIWGPAALPGPSDFFDSVQNAYLPSTVRMAAGIVQVFAGPRPSTLDFWGEAKRYEQILQDYVPRLLRSAGHYFKSTAFTEVTSTMHHIVDATAVFRDSIQGTLDARNVTLDELTQELEVVFTWIVDDLKKIPSPDKAPGHADREDMVDKILMDTARALVHLGARYGIEENLIEAYLSSLEPHVRALIVVVGDINEQHPELLPALAFSVVGLLMPESWILRPFLSLFGFGPSGPVKGSLAAWLQRRFWGAAIKPGSWFAWLQAAGMGNIPRWAGHAIKVPLAIGAGLLAMLFPCFY